MKEPDALDDLLRQWKLPEPTAELDRRVIAAYRPVLGWRRFWTLRVSVPAPALVAVALVLVGLLIWLRPAATPAASVPPREKPGAVTQLDASGFQPLPNGEARVIPAMEIPK